MAPSWVSALFADNLYFSKFLKGLYLMDFNGRSLATRSSYGVLSRSELVLYLGWLLGWLAGWRGWAGWAGNAGLQTSI